MSHLSIEDLKTLYFSPKYQNMKGLCNFIEFKRVNVTGKINQYLARLESKNATRLLRLQKDKAKRDEEKANKKIRQLEEALKAEQAENARLVEAEKAENARLVEAEKLKKIEAQKLKRNNRAKEKRAVKKMNKPVINRFQITIKYTYRVVFHNHLNPKKRREFGGAFHEWSAGDILEDTITRNVPRRLTADGVRQIVNDYELSTREYEYMHYEIIEIKKVSYVSLQHVKNVGNYNILDANHKGGIVNYAWIPDVKFADTGRCVYDALASLKRAPKLFKKPEEILKIFQEKNTVDNNNTVMTLDDGATPRPIKYICEKFDISHYCMDISRNIILKNIPKNQNYDILCYIAHDNHIYLIDDKKIIKSLSQSRTSNLNNVNSKIAIANNKEDAGIKGQIYDDTPIDKLHELSECVVIYQMTDLTKLLLEIYSVENILYKHMSRRNKITQITYKNNVVMMCDPNLPMHIIASKDPLQFITYKHVKEICDIRKIPFTNQAVTAVIYELTFMKLNNKARVIILKQEKIDLLVKQDHKCNECKKVIDLKKCQFDHIIPLGAGGEDNINNIQALCIDCHYTKSKSEHENGEYHRMPAYASTFNNNALSVIKSDLFYRYAFIETVNPHFLGGQERITKHTPFYIDINKCRRNIMLYMAELGGKIPVYTCMDDVKEFKSTDKIITGNYYVCTKTYMPLRGNGWYSDVMVKYCIQKKIISISDIKYKLCSSLTLEDNYFNEVINSLLTLPYGLAKGGPNMFVGLFNKKANERTETYYSTSFSQVSTKYIKSADSDLKILNQFGDTPIFQLTTTERFQQDTYTNVIYNLVMDLEAIELHKLSCLIEQNGGHATFYNTDCVECWFDDNKPMDLENLFWDDKKTVLKYKYEVKEIAPYYERMKNVKHTEIYINNPVLWNVIPDPKINDFAKIATEIINSKQSININGISGAGKTTLVRLLITLLEKAEMQYIALAPTNKSARILHKNAITIDKFMNKHEKNASSLKKALSNINYIFVDEISMVRELFYSFFLTMKRIKPTIIFIISGDFHQIEPVKDRAIFDYENCTALHELCEGQRQLLTDARRSDKSVYNLSLDVMALDKTKMNKQECPMSICYTNRKRKEINAGWNTLYAKQNSTSINISKWVHDPQSQDYSVYVGLPLIGRMNNRKLDISNNETFVVTKIDFKKKFVHIADLADDSTKREIPVSEMSKLFHLAYCVTTHSVQGSTIDQPMTIYEWDMMSQKLKYTALTRVTKLEHLNII